MAWLERWLQVIWYGARPAPWLLRILAGVYAQVLQWRAPISTQQLPIPVWVIGNFTVGGTGKTPLMIALLAHLQSKGVRVGVVSRGYGRKSRLPHSVLPTSTVDEAGDEPLLIAQRSLAPVRVDADRLAAATYLMAQGCQLIVSDDGLQHRRLPRQLELEVFDFKRAYGNAMLLPAGPLREAVRAVDLRVGNGAVGDAETAFAMQLCLQHAVNLYSGEQRPLAFFLSQSFSAVAGIGHPARFFDALRALGLQFDAVAFADHHRFRAEDLPKGTLLMTEKDAVKCAGFARTDIWSVPVEAKLSAAFYSAIDAHLAATGVQHA